MKKLGQIEKSQDKNINKFLLSTKRLLLTYPLCKEIPDKTTLHKYFIDFFNRRKANIQTIVTAFEESDDEDVYKHFHVLICLDRKITVRRTNTLDVHTVHGNYQSIRSYHEALSYVIKDKNYLVDGNEISLVPKSKASLEQIYLFLINKTKQIKTWKRYKQFHHLNLQQAINKASTFLSPEDKARYVLRSKDVNKYVAQTLLNEHKQLFCNNYVSYTTNDFNIPLRVTEWQEEFSKDKTLVLIGKSGMGKTELAKALNNNPLLISHIDQLKELDISKHDCVIFDDMCFKHWPRESVIHLTDLANDRGINVKGDYATIPAGLKRIITSNRSLEGLFPNWKDDAIERRIYVVDVTMNFNLKVSCYEREDD